LCIVINRIILHRKKYISRVLIDFPPSSVDVCAYYKAAHPSG
jgi:hypothetical protein